MIGGRRDPWPRRRVWRHRLTWRGKLVLATAAASGLVLAAVGSLVAVLRSVVSPADRAVLDRVLDEQSVILFWGGALFVGLAGLGAFRLVRLYVVRPRDLAASTRLIASVNPSRRLAGGGPAELHQFAMAVNELADRYQASTADVTARIAAAQADVEAQRSRLAALMAELSVAVLVCNADGRILLYNAAASRLLNGPGTVGGPVGLGRSVFAVIDRDLVAFAIDRASSDDAAPGEVHAATVARGEALLRARVVPVADPAGAASSGGFVVTLEDLTREAVADQQRDAVIRALTADSRAAIANLRAAVESLVDYPDMPTEQQARFLAIVHDEATALSEKIETAVAAPEHLDRRLAPTDMLGRDLLDTLARRLQAAGLDVAVEDLPEPLWLVIDPYAVVRAVAHLGRRLLEEHRRRAVTLRLDRSGRYARLDLRWRGEAVDSRTLARWTAEPLTAAGAGSGATVDDVLASHGGEIWPGESTGTDEYLRLLLPVAERPRKAPRVPGPATEPGDPDDGARGTRAAGRPGRPAAVYDFSFLEPDGDQVGAGWDSRPLDRTSYTVFDTETTGLFPAQGDEIISIGALRIVNRRLLRQESYEQLVDPRRTVPESSVRIHGITPDLLVGMPTIEAVLPGFADFAADTVLVGHNAAFDLQFLRAKERACEVRFDQPVLDTLLLSAVVHPEHESHALDAVAERLGVDVIGRHTALGDAILTAEIFLRLLDLLAERDIRTLGQARTAARAVAAERFGESLYSHT